jgi:hypothetical protein
MTSRLLAVLLGTVVLTVAQGALSVLTPPAPPLPSPSLWPVVAVQPAWLALAPPLYVVLYFVAGMAIWPLVASFYQARPMPSGWLVAGVQVVRGFGFGLVVYLMVRRLRLGRTPAALAAGAVLAILGGIAPLLVPNPYLPAHVRLAHMPETAISNFLFGAILGWALRTPARQALQHRVTAART